MFCPFHQCWIQWVQHQISRLSRLPLPQLNSTVRRSTRSVDSTLGPSLNRTRLRPQTIDSIDRLDRFRGLLNTGDFFNHVNLCSCACQSANIQQQESRAVAGVLGLKFANIIHWLKLTIVGIASLPVKILRTNEWQYWKMPLSTAALSFDAPF